MKEIPINSINLRSWSHADQPDRIQSHCKHYDKRIQRHEKPESFDDLPEEIKTGFRSIRNYIQSILPDVQVYAWGSRLEGNYLDISDWDVMVKTKKDLDVLDLDCKGMKVHAVRSTKKEKFLIDG